MSDLICKRCNIRNCECVPYDVECDSCIRAYEQGRTDAIDEIAEAFNEHLFDSPMMNPIMTRNEILLFLEQLKEQKGGAENG